MRLDTQPGDPSVSGAQARQIEEACSRFEAAWLAASGPEQRPGIDSFLSAVPEPARSTLRARLVALEAELRGRAGETLGPANPCGGVPALPAADGIAATSAPTVDAESTTPGAGARPPALPGYDILHELGRGGMGVVYKARQRGLQRLVAVKMVRAGVEAGPRELARFRTEAEAVARLQHPNIVQIHEVGEADGRPFIVLEFVGSDLSTYLAGTPQAPRAAAGLVETLARAVAAAHQRGIVHRDLKPTNILLAGDPGSPASRPPLGGLVPKIADFGLAKLLPGEAGTPAPDRYTESGAIVGTPSYMAPEQARGKSKDVGPAADVYALGAVLYECLTGRPPFKGESTWETLRQVINDEPVPPTRLQPRLPRDLETICLKCLQKEPHRRYASAAALADDLHRFLAGQTIRARPVGTAGRVWRWARREPVLAGLLAAVLLTLTGGLTGMGLLWRRARANYAESERQYARAEESSRDARRAVEAMLGEVAEKQLTDVPEMEPVQRALLEKAADFYQKFLAERGDDPALREEAARAYNRLGLINQRLGRLPAAQAAYEQALALHTTLADEMPAEPRYRRLVAMDLSKGLAELYLSGQRYAEAEGPLGRARDLLVPLADAHAEEVEYQEDLADCYQNLGILWSSTGRLDEAERAYGQSLRIRERLERAHPTEQFRNRLAASHQSLATLYQTSKRGRRAEAEFQNALAVWDRLLQDHPQVTEYQRALGRCRHNLGWLYLNLGQAVQSEAALRKACTTLEKVAREHPSSVGDQANLAAAYRSLGLACGALGRSEESEALALKALEIMERYPSDVPRYRADLANTYQNLAWRYFSEGKYEKAERYYDQALAQSEALVRQCPDVPQYRRTLGFIQNGRGNLYAAEERLPQAVAAFQEAVRVREKVARDLGGEPESLDNVAWSYSNLGDLYGKMGRTDLAVTCQGQALATRERLVRENPRVPRYTVSLAASYSAEANRLRDGGQAADSLEWYGRAIGLLENVLKAEPRHDHAREELCTAYWGRATALSKQLNRHAEALPDWERARALDNGEYGDRIRVHQAITYARLGKHARATADVRALESRAASEHKTLEGETYDVMAHVYALSASAAAADRTLSGAERARLSSEYAARAVNLLQRLRAQGHFKDREQVEHLKSTPELEVLRGRQDFQKLLRDLGQPMEGARNRPPNGDRGSPDGAGHR
jgi:tetratricopeptide (TPR) repeat protein